MPKDIQKQIQAIAGKIAREYDPEKIILFGSQARGDSNYDSDVDLFIVKETPERRIDRARAVRQIIWGSGLPVDILVYTPQEVDRELGLEDFFIKNVTESGKVLYEKI